MQKEKGFSLIELMVVVAIISLLVAIAVPNMGRWMADRRLKSAVQDLVGNMRWAKMNAIKENKEWAIVFEDTDNNPSYFVCSETGDNGWADISDNTIVKTINLNNYGSSVDYGHGDTDKKKATISSTPSTENIDDDISYSSDVVVFTPKGIMGNLGYVYLQNDVNTIYAIGTPTWAGVVVVNKWLGNGWAK